MCVWCVRARVCVDGVSEWCVRVCARACVLCVSVLSGVTVVRVCGVRGHCACVCDECVVIESVGVRTTAVWVSVLVMCVCMVW